MSVGVLVDGVLLDLLSANAVVQVADVLIERNREPVDGLAGAHVELV